MAPPPQDNQVGVLLVGELKNLHIVAADAEVNPQMDSDNGFRVPGSGFSSASGWGRTY
jgi:hypothetical protein